MEESTINDLYMKYTNEVEGALEEDRYFQYLFEMIQAGDNTLEQKNRVLHKVVDERWLTVVEEGIESIFNIVGLLLRVRKLFRSLWRRKLQRTAYAT